MTRKNNDSMAQQVFDEELLEPIDHYFACRIGKGYSDQAQAFLAYLLKSAREGHLCITVEEDLLSPSLSSEWDPILITGSKEFENNKLPSIICQNHRFYLKQNWDYERCFVENLQRIANQKPEIDLHIDPNELVGLEDEQKNAIVHASINALSLICGGPGTGKTYTAKQLVELFLKKGIKDIVLTAPTGKAAANLRQFSDQCRVGTLHALLRDKENFSADVVLVDEGSMVDAETMARLFSSVKAGARLILLGDKDQLPPVEAGNFFSDLCKHNHFTAHLNRCLRSELEELVGLGNKIKRGECVPYLPLSELQNIYAENKKILTPLRKGFYGVDHLNKILRERLNSDEIPIMVTVNDHRLQLFNGETGILKEGMAYFSDDRVFPEYLLPHYEYAYVLSVHKSQGSEYDHVRILLPKGSEVFGREMLYTAVTRAKKSVEIWAHEGVLEQIVAKHSKRLSGV